MLADAKSLPKRRQVNWRHRFGLPAHSLLQRHDLDQRRGDPVSAFESCVHKAKEVDAGMLASKLQAPLKGRFRGHLEERRVLTWLGAGIAAERVWVWTPEKRADRARVDACGHLRRHLGKVGTERVERRLGV